MLKEFKEFAIKGNVIDMAVGIIIGAAFGKIVSAFVDGIVMPPIGKVLGGTNFSKLFINLADDPEKAAITNFDAAVEAGIPMLKWGAFVQTTIDFLIVAFVIFIMVKMINNAKKQFEKEQEAAAPAEPPANEVLLAEIRDLLKK